MIRSLDFFQKISVDNLTKPTLVGSILSMSAISIIVFLLFREISHLFSPIVKKSSDVIQDRDHHSKINVNLEINFPNIPCNLISVDQEDSIGNHRMDISDSLAKDYLDKDGKLSVYNSNENGIESLIQAVTQNKGCKIHGVVSISKVPGDIHISFHNYGYLYNSLMIDRKDLFDKLQLNHKLNSLTFGDVANNQNLLRKFDFSIEDNKINSFNQNSNLPSFLDEKKRKNYMYFIKLIPHRFRDTFYAKEDIGYQYSMTSRSADLDEEEIRMPVVIIQYDFSPISMVLRLESTSLLHFLTNVCAIVGGVYVFFSILNRFLIGLFDSKE